METLHPKIVHFPVAMLFLAGLLYLLHFFIRHQNLDRFAFFLHAGGVAATVAAILSGNYAEADIVQTEAIHEIVEEHEFLGMLTAWAFGLLLVWAYLRQKTKVLLEKIAFTGIFVVGLGLLTIAAAHGGELVYDYGAGVKPMKEHLIQQRNKDQGLEGSSQIVPEEAASHSPQ